MGIIVKEGKIRHNKIYYGIGNKIEGLSQSEESRLVSLGVAEYIQEEAPVDKPSKLIPEGNVESLKKLISTIEDVGLLKGMIIEENAEHKRKTLSEAIQKRIDELVKVEEDEETDSDKNLTLDFNPEEVMPE